MTDEQLIESLRLWNRDDAADRIEELLADLARSTRVISKMVPLSADGNHVFWDGVGEIELDHNGKLRAGVEEATKALLEIHRIVPLHPAGDIALSTLKKLKEMHHMTDEELIARLRNTPNWMREGFQNWKDNVRTYDTAPFEAADRIEELLCKNDNLFDLAQQEHSRAERLAALLDRAVNGPWLDGDLERARAALKGADHE